jgi:3-oxoadipate enol-lactonase
MIGQAFALKHAAKLKTMMLCDTMPQTPPEAAAAWGPRVKAVREANSLAPLGDGTMERWFTDAYKPKHPGRWKQIRDTIVATTPAGFLGCAAAIQNFDFVPKLPTITLPTLVVCGDGDAGTPPAGNKKIAELIPGGRYEEIAAARHFPNVEQAETFNRIMMGWLGKHR